MISINKKKKEEVLVPLTGARRLNEDINS